MVEIVMRLGVEVSERLDGLISSPVMQRYILGMYCDINA